MAVGAVMGLDGAAWMGLLGYIPADFGVVVDFASSFMYLVGVGGQVAIKLAFLPKSTRDKYEK